MSGISPLQQARIRDNQEKEFQNKMRDLKMKFREDYNKEVNRNRLLLERVKKENKKNESSEEIRMEEKLKGLRVRHQELLRLENDRLAQELRDLKISHDDQVGEKKETNDNEIKEMSESHQNYIRNIQENFNKAKAKYEV